MHTLKVRHGHMPGITTALMTEGMLADYDEVSRVTLQVAEIVRPARQIQVRSAKGSDIVAQFSPDSALGPLSRPIPPAGHMGQPAGR